MTLYYIEPVTIPSNSAHSLQININCTEISNVREDFTLISYKYLNDKTKLNFKHISFVRPNFFNKIIPYSTFHLLYKLRNINFNIHKDFLITRSPFIAWFYSNKFKKIFLELHSLPQGLSNLCYYFIFEFILFSIPLFFLKKKESVILGVISNGLKEDLIVRGFSMKQIVSVPDGVDLEKFNIKISKIDARKKLCLPINRKIISYVGSTDKNRDLQTLIKVAKKLPEIIFCIYGQEQKYLLELIKGSDNVFFGGFIKNPEVVYKASDILFAGYTNKITTINYMSPLKVFEYMASKRPIILANFIRNKEIISNTEASYYESEDIDNLLLTINQVFFNSKLASKISNNAFKKVSKYTWTNRINYILKLLNM